MYIKTAKIDGWKRCLDAEVTLRPLTYVTGANGSGKTAVLDAVRLVATGTTAGIPDTLDGLAQLMPGSLARFALEWDDGVMFARSWDLKAKTKETILAVEGGRRLDPKPSEVAIEARMGSKHNLSYSAAAFLAMSGDKRRMAVLRAIQLPGVSEAEVKTRWGGIVKDTARRLSVDNDTVVKYVLAAEVQRVDGLDAALSLHERTHALATQATADRKRREGEAEGVSELSSTVSGEVLRTQRERVKAVRETHAQLREQMAASREVERQILAASPGAAAKEDVAAAAASLEVAEARLEALRADEARLAAEVRERDQAERLLAERVHILRTHVTVATKALQAVAGGECSVCRQAVGPDAIADYEEAVTLAEGAVAAVLADRNPAPMETAKLALAQVQSDIRTAEPVLVEQRRRLDYMHAQVARRAELPAERPDLEALAISLSEAARELTGAEIKLQELERQRAAAELRETVTRALEEARVQEAFLRELDTALGPRGLLGEVLDRATTSFTAALSSVSARTIEVQLVDTKGKDTFTVGLRRGERVVDMRALSGAERGEVLAATTLALEKLRGAPWKAALVDDVDRLDMPTALAFGRRLQEAHAAGHVDQVILAGHDRAVAEALGREGWHVVRMAGP